MVMLLLILVLAFVGQMSIASLAIGQSGSVGETLGRAFRRVWGVLVTIFIVIFPVVAIAIIATGSALVRAGLTEPGSITPDSLAAVPGIGPILILFIFALLSVWARFFPVSAVAMKEGSSPLTLLSRSWKLTKGNFWRLLGTVLLIVIVETVVTQAFTYIGGSIFTLALGPADPYSASALLIALLVSLAGAAVSVIGAILIGRIYDQLSGAALSKQSVPDVKRES
jgi:hypothetical protein